MTSSIRRYPFAFLMLLGIAGVCCAALLASAPAANAGFSNYCGGNLGGLQTCFGGARWLNAVGGSGANHSVCVGTSNYENVTCSGGPGQFTYNPQAYANVSPWIYNQGATVNSVQGVAYFP